jgi:GDPmannose 4,6-dehydratase
MYACNGVLFNHESERRGEEFVTRKITKAVGARQFPLVLGNLDAKRDWGHAQDYIEGMWHIMQQDTPDDYVCATGEMRTVREFCEHAFDAVGLPVRFEGEGVDEKGICVKTGRVLIEVSPDYFRPAEVEQLLGNPAKAERVLGWKPKVTFKELVQIMAKADWELAKAGK